METTKLEIFLEVNPKTTGLKMRAETEGDKQLLKAAIMSLFDKSPKLYELFQEAIEVQKFKTDHADEIEELTKHLKS